MAEALGETCPLKWLWSSTSSSSCSSFRKLQAPGTTKAPSSSHTQRGALLSGLQRPLEPVLSLELHEAPSWVVHGVMVPLWVLSPWSAESPRRCMRGNRVLGNILKWSRAKRRVCVSDRSTTVFFCLCKCVQKATCLSVSVCACLKVCAFPPQCLSLSALLIFVLLTRL